MPNNDFLILLLPQAVTQESEALATAWRHESGIALRVAPAIESTQFDRHWLRIHGDTSFCLQVARNLDIELISPPEGLVAELGDEWTASGDYGELTAAGRAAIANGTVASYSTQFGHEFSAEGKVFAEVFAGQIVAAPAFIAEFARLQGGRWIVTGVHSIWDAEVRDLGPIGFSHALRYAARPRNRKAMRGRARDSS